MQKQPSQKEREADIKLHFRLFWNIADNQWYIGYWKMDKDETLPKQLRESKNPNVLKKYPPCPGIDDLPNHPGEDYDNLCTRADRMIQDKWPDLAFC